MIVRLRNKLHEGHWRLIVVIAFVLLNFFFRKVRSYNFFRKLFSPFEWNFGDLPTIAGAIFCCYVETTFDEKPKYPSITNVMKRILDATVLAFLMK